MKKLLSKNTSESTSTDRVDIIGYEGMYQIDEESNIFSSKYSIGRVISQYVNKQGYSLVSLSVDGIKKTEQVHRLVAIAHIPNPEGLPCVCHKKESFPLDNSKENLFWGTHKDNMMDMGKKGRSNILFSSNHPLKGKYGKHHNRSKEVVQFSISGDFIKRWNSTRDVERELGILNQGISACIKGKRKTAGGFIWKR